MIVPWHRRWRLFKRGLWYTLAAVLVVLALGNGIGSQLLPLAERHPQDIAAWLSTRAQRKVAFDHVETEWTRRGPLLRLTNLRIGDGAEPLRVGNAEILVAQYTGLLPGRSFTELRVHGLDLTLKRRADGVWEVRGLPGQQTADADPLSTLEHLGELQVVQAKLRVQAPELGLDLRIPRIDVRLQVAGARVRIGARAWLRDGAVPLAVSADFDRKRGDGRVYANAQQLQLHDLSTLPIPGGVRPAAGDGKLQAWMEVRGHRVVGVQATVAVRDLAVTPAPLPGTPTSVQTLGAFELNAAWSGSASDWRLHIDRLRIGSGASAQQLNQVAVAGGRHYGLHAQRVDAAPLLQLAALSDVLSPQLRHWLHHAKPGGVLEAVNVAGVRGQRLQVAAHVQGFRFDPVVDAPGMRGVSGWLQGDAEGLRFRFDPTAQVAFDWPAGFGVVHTVKLDGEAVMWRDDAGWTAHTPGLAIDGTQLHLRARGGIGFQNDGTHPHLDIAADIGEVPITFARGFWIHHLMPKATVQWLDDALQGGSLRNIHAIVAGDLDDWPFRNESGMAGAGVFRADAQIANGRVKFQPDWPAAEHMNADVSFVADGFTVVGSAVIAGVRVPMLKAGIASFHRAELTVDAATAGDAGGFLNLLQHSPLRARYGEVMDHLQAAGPAQATFHMRLPLHHDHPVTPEIAGEVTLAATQLRETRWKLNFDQVRGQARYDEGGFIADNLAAQFSGTPSVLSLRAGPHVRKQTNVFEADLRATVPIDELLGKADAVKWLQPYFDGRSAWAVNVAVAAQDAPPRIRLTSDLVGTRINLPEPLHKAATQPLPAQVEISLPMERGEVAVTLGTVVSLRSRSNAGRTGLRLQFGGTAPAPPAAGLVIGGQVERLDGLDWVGALASAPAGGDLPLQRIELKAKSLRMLGAGFADVQLVVAPATGGTAVQLRGATLAGALMVPQRDGGTVAGRFERMYWTPPADDKASRSDAPSTFVDDLNPAKVPPLVLDIGDLRVGSVAMGAARLRTTPMADGLSLNEFSTRDGRQRVQASGSWRGLGTATRTQLAFTVDSDDIGALVGGLGLGGQVAGGKGQLIADMGWPGGPGAFTTAAVDAKLTLDARDGRLLEIEPGAGRVLGLLGVAQLPRRLLFDFRDFFGKGFAFDHIRGHVRLNAGVARTQDLVIDGPAAKIQVQGSADLRNERFDQTVTVSPKSGGLLTAVGALAGGPVGAAVGAVANAVLDKPLQGLAAKTYRVTGPWKSPEVQVVNDAKASTPPRQ